MKNPNQWYCGVEGQQFGPFTWEQMRGMAAEGRIVGDSFVRRDVDPQWFQASQIPGLVPKAHQSGSASTIGKSVAGVAAAGKAAPAGKSRTAAGTARVKPSDSTTVVAGAMGDTVRVAKVAKVKASGAATAKAQPPAAVPMGQAVSSPAVGVPVGTAMPFVLQTPPTAPASPAAKPTDAPPQPAGKSNNSLILVAALGGVAAVVGVVGVGLIVWKYSQSAVPAEEQLAAAMQSELKESLEKIASDLEGNPLAPELDPQAAAALPTAAGALANGLAAGGPEGESASPGSAARTSPVSTAAATKLLTSISNWTSVTNLRGIALNNLRLQVASAWLATDDKGTRVEPAVGGQSNSAAKYVFVELRITNTAPVPRKYKSWNTASGTSVVLGDQANEVLSLVPPAATPSAKRLTAVDIAPGEAVTDQLVFAAPTGAIEKFKLALAKSALAEGVKFKSGTHFALEIPLEVLLVKANSNSSPAVADAAVLANQAPAASADAVPASIAAPAAEAAIAPAGDKPMAVAAAGQPEMKKRNEPPTTEELNRQFEDLSKGGDKDKDGKDKDMEKKGEAQK